MNQTTHVQSKVWLPDHGPRIILFLFQVSLPLMLIISGYLLGLKIPLLLEEPNLVPAKMVEIMKSKDLHLSIFSQVEGLKSGLSIAISLCSIIGYLLILVSIVEATCLSFGVFGPISFFHRIEKRRGYFVYKPGQKKITFMQNLQRSLLTKGAFLH